MDYNKLISFQTEFALRFGRHVLSKRARDYSNALISPCSIHVVLSLIAAGTSNRDLLSFLKSEKVEELNSLAYQLVTIILADGSSGGGPRLSFVNGVWVEKSMGLNSIFQEIATGCYRAEVKGVDFRNKAEEVRKEVNKWAEKETNGLIKDLLPPGSVTNGTDCIFGNAIYCKGEWQAKFDKSLVEDFDFYLLDGTTVQVPFMTSYKMQYIAAFDGFKVLQLPYKRNLGREDMRRFSMCFFLPDKNDGLQNLLEKMGSDPGFIDRHIPRGRVKVRKFRIPKFKMSDEYEVSKELGDLGLSLTGVSTFRHKSFIEINEEGSEAAAASAAVMCFGSMGPPPEYETIDFVADHPFLFLIREDTTGVVLFIGHVVNPKV